MYIIIHRITKKYIKTIIQKFKWNITNFLIIHKKAGKQKHKNKNIEEKQKTIIKWKA